MSKCNISREYGIYDIHGIYNNPLTNEPYKNLYANSDTIEVEGVNVPKTYSNILKNLSTKIVYKNKDLIIDTIANNQIILLTAGTGVGKTILVPRIALHTFDYKEKVICTIPKRAPTLANASFIAECLDSNLGEHVGYFYQGTNQTNKNGIESKLILTTTGSLISRMTGNDPLLSDYKCILVDEAHERSVQTDQLLLLLKHACLKRPDLKVIVMSATIDLQRFRDYFPKSKFKFGEVDAGSELSFNVKEAWLDKMPLDWKKTAIDITMNILKKTAIGDIMIFVKSGGDANQICMKLDIAMSAWRKTIIQENKDKPPSSKSTRSTRSTRKTKSINSTRARVIPPEYKINPFCIKLEGASSKEDQRLATDQHKYKTLVDPRGGYPYTRKIVVTTNVAESSITVNGIVFIIDSGYEYTEAYEPNSRVRSLLENTIAQSAVKQRKGRAGRTQEGYCFHLYSQTEFKNFEKYPIPSIEKSDITSDILDLMRLPEASTVKKLRNMLDEFISPPHEKFILNSLRTLQALGAITDITPEGTITPMGYAITKFRAIKANYARALIASYYYGCSRSMCDLIALITVTDGMISLIYLEYYADKRKSPEWNKKESQRYMQIMKGFAHPMGDFMTLLKTYRIYLKNAIKTPDIEPELEVVKVGDGEVLLELDEQNEEQKSVKKWCRDNYIHSNRMAQARKISRQLYDTLIKLVRPLEQQYKKYTKRQSIDKKNMKDLVNFAVVDEVITELNDVVTKEGLKHERETKKEMTQYYKTHLDTQIGGFMNKIDKQLIMDKLEQNVKRFPTEEENILMALSIGNFVNLAVKTKDDNVYVSCFAQNKKFAKVNRDSFLNTFPKMVIYDEMFMSSADAKYLKLNIVGKIPDNVFARIKELYGKYIKYC